MDNSDKTLAVSIKLDAGSWEKILNAASMEAEFQRRLGHINAYSALIELYDVISDKLTAARSKSQQVRKEG